MIYIESKKELLENGYSILNNIYSDNEIEAIIHCIKNNKIEDESYLRSKDLFAIRQLLNGIPELKDVVFNNKLISLLSEIFNKNFFLTKAIYFDKPKESNWFVAYHQDLTISVTEKKETQGYKNWTYKKGQYGVQPPIEILENTITVRIHLDDTDKSNGALKIISGSHSRGIVRTESNQIDFEKEEYCEIEKGGIMLMKPLLFHASNKSTDGKQRRVIHLEFNSTKIDSILNWSEFQPINIPAQN